MSLLWIVSQSPNLGTTLAAHLRELGEVWSGPAESAHWKDAPPADLMVWLGVEAEPAALERFLEFLYRTPQRHGAPAALLYAESARGETPELVASLVDDRPFASVSWPLDPSELVTAARGLLERLSLPLSLRGRARRDWVASRVERLYAGVDLPALRQAIDPRESARPILLVGEPGTRRGLLARYIHDLSEPAREQLIPVPLATISADELERRLIGATGGRGLTLFLPEIDAATPLAAAALAQLLSDSGALGIEPLRWIASAQRPDRLPRSLRLLPWIRVDLPPLREREDFEELARGVATQLDRDLALSDAAIDRLREHAWTGNLQELEAAIHASAAGARESRIEVDDLQIPPETRQPRGRTADPGPSGPQQPSAAPVEPMEPAQTAPEPAPKSEVERPALSELLKPLAQEIRQPLLALRTYTGLMDQRPDDEEVRRGLTDLVEGDLAHLDELLVRLERFARFGPPELGPVDLAGLLTSELELRQAEMRKRSLVVLREIDHEVPPVLADEAQLRFAIGGLLDRALRMAPPGGDLFVGSRYRAASRPPPADGHRLLIRFHSPEELLVGPDDLTGTTTPIEVVQARALISRMGGLFAVDASGSQDNLILIELPGETSPHAAVVSS